MNSLTILIAGSVLVALGRLTIPGHALTGWPGFYEAFSHIWIGVLLAFVIFERGSKQAAAWVLIMALTALEVVMFLHRPL